MANVLLISYQFPPSGGVGVPRALAYCRYLPEHGCRLTVIAPRNPATPVQDPELARLIPPGTRVLRAFNPEVPYAWRDRIWRLFSPPHRTRALSKTNQQSSPSERSWSKQLKGSFRRAANKLMFPDVMVTWVPFALRMASRVIERDGIDTLIVNAPPFSQFKIAVELKKRYPHLRLITDVRDDWLGYYLLHFDSEAESKVAAAKVLERAVVECSDYIASVTPAMQEKIRLRYPEQPDAKFLCIPNGYEPDYFADFKPQPRSDDRTQVTYFGSVFMTDVYSPEPYFRALESLPSEVQSRFQTRFIGRVADEARTYLESRPSDVQILGFMSKLSGLRQLQNTDYVLVIVATPTAHSQKIVEYLGTGRPILAITPHQGNVAELLRETRTGWSADPGDHEGIRRMLLEADERRRNRSLTINPNWAAIRKYSWPDLIARLLRETGLQPSLTDEATPAAQSPPAVMEATSPASRPR